LYIAAKLYREAITRALIENGADIKAKDQARRTGLHDAVTFRREGIVYVLMESGADLSMKDNNGWAPLHLGIRRGHKTVVELLL
ncbi:ankyrin repeat protein, partial [Glonium stellatum]